MLWAPAMQTPMGIDDIRRDIQHSSRNFRPLGSRIITVFHVTRLEASISGGGSLLVLRSTVAFRATSSSKRHHLFPS